MGYPTFPLVNLTNLIYPVRGITKKQTKQKSIGKRMTEILENEDNCLRC